MGIFTYDILVKESVGVLVRRSGKANKESIKILQDLPPLVINGTVALVNDDEVKELRWVFCIIFHLSLCSCRCTRFIVHVIWHGREISCQHRIYTLNGTYADLCALRNIRCLNTLNVIQGIQFLSAIVRLIVLVFCLSLHTKVLRVNKEKYSFGFSKLQQPICVGDSGISLSSTSCHLHQ